VPSARSSSASFRSHGLVRIVPFAQHAQADEVLLLAVDLLERVGARLGQHFGGRQVLAVQFFDLDLDRHAVAIPARHIRRIEAGQLRDLTTMSFRILLTAWPRWMSPLAYGGPSCRMNFGRPLAALRTRS
jgi:hypothetical protein